MLKTTEEAKREYDEASSKAHATARTKFDADIWDERAKEELSRARDTLDFTRWAEAYLRGLYAASKVAIQPKEGADMLKEIQRALIQFQEVCQSHGVSGTVEVHMPVEHMRKMATEWTLEPVWRPPGQHLDMVSPQFEVWGPRGRWALKSIPKPGALPELKLGGVAQALVESERAKVRDAALEDAERALMSSYNGLGSAHLDPMWRDAFNHTLVVIRALKSKTATGNGDVEKLRAGFEALQQEGMKGAAAKWERGEMDGPTPEPVHDFGWALARMREGKKVRRDGWGDAKPGTWMVVVAGGHSWFYKTTTEPEVRTGQDDLLATDWQVVE